jgi:ABC-2 type transport system ATP-binding protein
MSRVLEVQDLAKTYRKPFSGRKVAAVLGISFHVERGEVFGFLGPNGAGKTTTIKMLTGLMSATSGTATLLGQPIPSAEAMGRVGFLPENPYVYPYLTPYEYVSMCGRLNGLGGSALRDRVESSLKKVGVAYAMDRPVRALSKGMLQRTGLAAALVHDPELLILDEPMSGLDPVGRKEVRDIILDERRAGRTVFFSSHILADVELLCDRVCMLWKGKVVVYGSLSSLLSQGAYCTEVTLRGVGSVLREQLEQFGKLQQVGERDVVEVLQEVQLGQLLQAALAGGSQVESVVPKRQTLEQIFVQSAVDSPGDTVGPNSGGPNSGGPSSGAPRSAATATS